MRLLPGAAGQRKIGILAVALIVATSRTASSQGPSFPVRHALSNPVHTMLQPGSSSFVIPLPKGRERTIRVLNQNLAAEGRFSIAVSNQRLPAGSPAWDVVAGAIRFRHHRQFAVPLDGIEAKYVRLTFEVRRPDVSAK